MNAGGANEGQHRLIQENETFDKNDTADKFNLDQLHTNSGGNDPGSTEQRKNANNQQIQEATHQYNASATTVIDNSATQGTDEKLGQQLRDAPVVESVGPALGREGGAPIVAYGQAAGSEQKAPQKTPSFVLVSADDLASHDIVALQQRVWHSVLSTTHRILHRF